MGSDDGWHYIVFEYIEGTNLRDMIARFGPFDLERSINVLIQIADALEHASQRDVVHRDIKLENLLLTGDKQTLKIADFGLAKDVSEDAARTIIGTEKYQTHLIILNYQLLVSYVWTQD